MKCVATILTVFTALSLGAQGEVTILAAVEGCAIPLQVYAFTGFGFEPVAVLEQNERGDQSASVSVDEPVFRYLGPTPADALPLILTGGDTIEVEGSCGQMRQATVASSPINAAYTQLKATFDEQNERYSTLVQDIEVVRDERVNRDGREAMRELDEEKRQLVQQLKEAYPILGRIASLNTYLSHYSAEEGQYANQLDHYIGTFFQFVDFGDSGYDDLAWTYEGGRNFTDNLLRALPADRLTEAVLEQTGRWPAGSRARFMARSGALASLLTKKHPAGLEVADQLIEEYADAYPDPIAALRQQTAPLRSSAIGAPAPLFTASTPDGGEISLESLRGKVVLLDFWASWCGPCRRENPNVVRMYNKYKDEGFEILGVSLDDRKDRWENAIAADKLTWLHVSDLRGWKSEYGQLYGVTSIPQTVLLDRDGNILARNLRGRDLERKLAEVLGVK
ncbi:peroxiredoxin [Lewinella aquimaris]|uniref:Peroxiredoxin n=1 Tax=Neolewinella aquimaris TaxID=1835722 RepID=A0A840E3S5_9BACT|nr:TlpA disulfide reductase family protein [Neolewinella aquimaris]MBB4079841.1 peroxiredoxin [Neolewinella aquimaris]